MLFVLSLAQQIFQIQILLVLVHLLAAMMKDALQVQLEEVPANASTAHGIARLHVLVLLYMLRSVPKLNLPSATRAWLTFRAAITVNVSQYWLLPAFNGN
jgi:hypothetical protein